MALGWEDFYIFDQVPWSLDNVEGGIPNGQN
jgi:hypothetical protein